MIFVTKSRARTLLRNTRLLGVYVYSEYMCVRFEYNVRNIFIFSKSKKNKEREIAHTFPFFWDLIRTHAHTHSQIY